MKISAYLCNTYSGLSSQVLDLHFSCNTNTQESDLEFIKYNVSSIKKYCNKHDINLKIVTSDNPILKNLHLGTMMNPQMNKIIRYYDFLDSGDDYGIFLDTDTVVLNPNVNIADYINQFGESENFLWFTPPGIKDYVLEDGLCNINNKRRCVKAMQRYNDLPVLKAIQIPLIYSGFTILSRKLIEQYIEFSKLRHIDITNEDDILFLQRLQQQNLKTKDICVNDESLFEFFLTYHNSDYKFIYNQHNNPVGSKHHLDLSNILCDGHGSDFTISNLTHQCNKSIFWHLVKNSPTIAPDTQVTRLNFLSRICSINH